jgi:hypothetical protein
MLGAGIYASEDIRKARKYGKIIFRLLVYVGKVKKIDSQAHPERKSWQENYDSAWVPAGCGMVKSELTVSVSQTTSQKYDQIYYFSLLG